MCIQTKSEANFNLLSFVICAYLTCGPFVQFAVDSFQTDYTDANCKLASYTDHESVCVQLSL